MFVSSVNIQPFSHGRPTDGRTDWIARCRKAIVDIDLFVAPEEGGVAGVVVTTADLTDPPTSIHELISPSCAEVRRKYLRETRETWTVTRSCCLGGVENVRQEKRGRLLRSASAHTCEITYHVRHVHKFLVASGNARSKKIHFKKEKSLV